MHLSRLVLPGARLLLASAGAALMLLSLSGLAGAQVQQGATMTILRGEVALLRPDGSAVQPAPSGVTVRPGDEIRTLSPGGALITFFSGIEIEMGQETILVVERVSREGDRVDISLRQTLGVALSRVQTLADPGSSYAIQVGGAVAVARGSAAVTAVDPPVAALYTVDGVFYLTPGVNPAVAAGRGCWWNFDPGTMVREDVCHEFGLGGQSPWDTWSVVQDQKDEPPGPPDEEDEDDDGYNSGYPVPGAPTVGLLADRLVQGVDAFSATGSVLALGMIGWAFHDWRPKRRR